MDQIGTNESGKSPKRWEFNFVLAIVIGISVVAVVTLVTLTIQYFSTTQSTFQSLVSKVDTLIQQNEQLKQDEKDKEIQILQNQILLLKEKNPYLK